MYVHHVFHSDDDLLRRVGRRFVVRLRRLLCLYRGMGMGDALRAASVAWAFCGAAVDGDAAVVDGFRCMLHGECMERIEVDGMPLVVLDDDSDVECLIWDVACLLLEETEGAPQRAYDVAGRYASRAYRPEVMEVTEVEEVESVDEPSDVEEAMDVPCRGDELKEDWIRHFLDTADMADVESIKGLLFFLNRYNVNCNNRYKDEINLLYEKLRTKDATVVQVAAGGINIQNLNRLS